MRKEKNSVKKTNANNKTTKIEKVSKRDVKVNEKELKENLRGIENEIVRKKEIPKEEALKINKKVFENILIADVVMLFLYFISLGSLNIESAVFITDLKVFSMALIVFTIILFEYSYKKENGNICIHGIECLVLSIFMLFSIYLYTMYFRKFDLIIASASFIFAIYYVAKSIIIYRKMRKQYFESINDINEIIKK